MDIQSFFRKRRLDFSFSNKSRLKSKREEIVGTTFGEMLHQQTDSYKNTSLDKVIGSLKSIKNLHNLRIAAMTSAFVFFLLALDFAFPLVISDHTVEGVGTVSNTSLTLTTDHEQAKLNIVPTSTSGSFATSSDAEKAKFSVSTNNSTGYTLAIKGSSNNKLSNTAASTTLDSITTASTGIDAATFNTSTYNNKWGYMPSKYNSQSNTTKYYGITSSDVTLNETSAPNASGTSDNYSIGLGVKVDYNKPAGSYTNTFVLAAVGKPVSYGINYRDGGISGVTDLPDSQTGDTINTSVTINPNRTPARAGYTFANKWCLGTVNTTGNNPGTTCNGTVYNNGSSIDFINQTSSSSVVTLYAMWTPATPTLTSLTVDFAGEGVSGVLVWVIDESGIEPKEEDVGEITYSGGSIPGLQPGRTYYLTPFFSTGYTVDKWTKISDTGSLNYNSDSIMNDGIIAAFTMGEGDGEVEITGTRELYMQNFTLDSASLMRNGESKTLFDLRDKKRYPVTKINGNVWMTRNLNFKGNNLTPEDSNVSENTSIVYHETGAAAVDCSNESCITEIDNIGGYPAIKYNLVAAAAESVNTADSLLWPRPSSDICPKGWRLPTQAEQKGITGYKSQFNPTNDSQWWSSTWGINTGITQDGVPLTGMFALRYENDNLFINSERMFDRDNNLYIRCILIPSMQNLPSSITDSMAQKENMVLRDNRDGQYYTVSNFNGTVWMTRNLALGCNGTGLTYSNEIHPITVTPVESDVDQYGGTSTPQESGFTGSYDDREIMCNSEYGAWYNYPLATAMEIVGEKSNTEEASHSICPKNWRLPDEEEISKLVTTYSQLDDGGFNPTIGGRYEGSSLKGTDKGHWWSSAAYDGDERHELRYNDNNNNKLTGDRSLRSRGIYIRCVKR